MPRLKDRQKQIPNGLTFYQPETKWSPPRYASFTTIVDNLIQHREGNPFLTSKFGWSTLRPVVEEEVDAFNARICQQMGWANYIIGGDDPVPPPLPRNNPSPIPQSLGRVAAGAETLVEWIASGAEAVDLSLANNRAAICVSCPKNDKGDWTRYFTVPASEAIRVELNKRRQWGLSTGYDDKLQVCSACACPLKLKVHMPIANIVSHISEESRQALDQRCWITKES